MSKWTSNGYYCEGCGYPEEKKEWHKRYSVNSGKLDSVIFKTRCSSLRCRVFSSVASSMSMRGIEYLRAKRDGDL